MPESDDKFHYQLRYDRKSSHQQIVTIIRRLKRGPMLDVGAAQGLLGHLLAQQEPEFTAQFPIDAVEPHPVWSEEARPYYRHVYATGIEDAPLTEKNYQVVICADVLEHVVKPQEALQQLQKNTASDATFVISLPNVAHLSIRLMLLFGLFPKMEKGILDRTHLHFYTQKTARDMLDEAGLKVERVLPTVIPLEIWFGLGKKKALLPLLRRLQYVMVAIAPRVFAYQWIFIARPKN